MIVYVIKVALRGISPMIWRRLRVLESTTIADIHHIIQIAMGWDDEYLHSFHIFGKDYGITYDGGFNFSDNPYKIKLNHFCFDPGDRFTYTYNFYDYWLCDICIEDVVEKSTISVPVCTGGQGRLVNNIPYYRSDEVMALIDALDIIFNGDEATTTVGDVRELIEVYETKRFNRSAVNSCLQQPLDELT